MSISSLLVRGLNRGTWVWNDKYNSLEFVRSVQDKKEEKRKKKKRFVAINGLTYVALKVNFTFKTHVNEMELMDFRHYLKQKNSGRTDTIVTIQDCKTVAIFLCIQPLPKLFLKFYNLTTVNQLLRAVIVYIQFYLQTCETVVKNQHYLKGVSPGKTATLQALKKDMDDLRVLLGRFYAAIILSEIGVKDISTTDGILLFECFLRVSVVVVWIALERKYFEEIKIELERIFRSGNFNNFAKSEVGTILHQIKPSNKVILDGKFYDIDKQMIKPLNRLTSTSPIIHNFMQMDEPKLMTIGKQDLENLAKIKDERLKFLTKYMFLPEEKIQAEGVIIGILGLQRRLFDPLLYPCSKRVLKLLITSSPMDISDDRKQLRENAIKKAQRESEPQSPHIFDHLPTIPRPYQAGEKEEQNHEVKLPVGNIVTPEASYKKNPVSFEETEKTFEEKDESREREDEEEGEEEEEAEIDEEWEEEDVEEKLDK